MIFKEMDPELAMKAIEGYENELAPAQRAQDAFYRQFACPRCGGATEKHFLSLDHAFGDNESLVPRCALKCVLCDCVLDPHTGLIVELGNVGKIKERVLPTLVPIIDGREH